MITERAIQYWLFRTLAATHALIVPNYTPRRWSECDLFSVTKAGYFHEHEIKLTRGDFAADAQKEYGGKWQKVAGRYERVGKQMKHDRLVARDELGPACFWYVVPETLAAVIDVPAWAGLKAVKPIGRGAAIRIVRDAPRLHNAKLDAKVVEHARGVCYWRFWRERQRLMAALRGGEQ